MQANDATVSVILTTYYRDESLRRALDHIIDQTYSEIECIVVDDSGEQYANSIIKEYDSVEYIPHHENKGQVEAWHTGFKNSSGDFIHFHDDDDWLSKTKIEKQINKFRNHTEAGIVYCGVRHPNGVDFIPQPEVRGDVLKYVLTDRIYPVHPTTMLIQREVIEEAFPIPVYRESTDMVLQIELAKIAHFEYTPEVLVHRGGDNGRIIVSPSQRKTFLRIIDDYSQLYDQIDPKLKEEALERTYSKLANDYLKNNYWSVNAVAAYLQASRYAKEHSLRHFVFAGLSLIFGRWGPYTAKKVGSSIL